MTTLTIRRMAKTSALAVTLSVSAFALMAGHARAEECDINTPTLNGTGGATSNPSGTTLACGPNANADGSNSIAIGNFAETNGVGAVAIGGDADGGLAGAQALANQAIAIGGDATVDAGATGGIAIGGDIDGNTVGANVSGVNGIAIGAEAFSATGLSTAFGANAIANADVFGDPLQDSQRATAIGAEARAENNRATAVGAGAVASGNRSTALGTQAAARGSGSVAIGDRAQTGTPGNGVPNAVAIGRNTNAQAAGSVAIGADSSADPNVALSGAAVAERENQFVLGTRNHAFTAAGIANPDNRSFQSGPLDVVTTDAQGNLASDGGQIFRQLGEQGAGIAIATALENPDLVNGETFGLAANIGFFEGNSALAIAAMGVIGQNFMGANERWAVSGGVGVSLNENNYGGQNTDRTVAGRAGVQVSW